MSGEDETQHNLPQRFEHQGKWSNPQPLLVAGVALTGAAVSTLLLFSNRGLAIFVANFALLFVGILLLLTAKRARTFADITVDKPGLVLERRGKTTQIPWSDLRWAQQHKEGKVTFLMLYGHGMKRLDQIPSTVEQFETMCELVHAQLDNRPTEECAEVPGIRARKQVRWRLFLGIPPVLLGIAMLVMAQVMPHEIPRLNKHGVFGWGDVLDVYTEDSTRWLEYQVVADGQRGPVEKVEMEPGPWEALAAEEAWPSVEVVYLADDLSISFAKGQEMPSGLNSPIALYVKAGLAILMGLLILWSARVPGRGVTRPLKRWVGRAARRRVQTTA